MEFLKDPKNDRVVKHLAPPAAKPLNSGLLWPNHDNPSKLIRLSQFTAIKRTFKTRRKITQKRFIETNTAGSAHNSLGNKEMKETLFTYRIQWLFSATFTVSTTIC